MSWGFALKESEAMQTGGECSHTAGGLTLPSPAPSASEGVSSRLI